MSNFYSLKPESGEKGMYRKVVKAKVLLITSTLNVFLYKDKMYVKRKYKTRKQNVRK